jgi:hypothetical protein
MGFNDVAPTDVVSPVFAFYEHIGEDLGDEVTGFIVIKNHDEIHRSKRTKNKGAVLLCVDRTRGAFGSANRGVAVKSNHQGITLRSRKCQIMRMPSMEDVEAPIGKNKFFSLTVESVTFEPRLHR